MNGRTVTAMVALVFAAALLGPVSADAGGVRGGASVHGGFHGGRSHGHGGHRGGGHGHGHSQGFKRDGFTHHGHGGHFKGHHFFGHVPVRPGGRILVWVPGGWYWTGWSWVWVAGHWR
jgi:hypothetical protein